MTYIIISRNSESSSFRGRLFKILKFPITKKLFLNILNHMPIVLISDFQPEIRSCTKQHQ